MKKQSAQQIIDECEGLYTYWKVVCCKCKKIILVTNHKKKPGDVVYAGDMISTKYYKGALKDGEIIGCQCGNDLLSRFLGEQITEEEYKKIKKEIC